MATELNQDDKERKRIKRGSKLQKVHEIKQEATESETRQKEKKE